MAGDSSNIVVGSAVFYLATYGTQLPDLTNLIPGGNEGTQVDWSDFDQIGYTDDGIDLSYNPTFKDIKVDEEMAAVDSILDGEKATVTIKMAEATLANLNRAIAGSVYATDAEGESVTVGSATKAQIQKFVIGFEGPAPNTNLTRVFIGYKARPTGNVGMKMQRADKVIIPVEFELLADSTQSAGNRLFKYRDFSSAAS